MSPSRVGTSQGSSWRIFSWPGLGWARLEKKKSARKLKNCAFSLIFLGFSEIFSIFSFDVVNDTFFLKLLIFLVLKLGKARKNIYFELEKLYIKKCSSARLVAFFFQLGKKKNLENWKIVLFSLFSLDFQKTSLFLVLIVAHDTFFLKMTDFLVQKLVKAREKYIFWARKAVH